MNKIIYKNKDNTIGILTPIKEVLSLVGIKAIAEKDVPAPYKYPIRWETVTKTREQNVYNELEETTEILVVEYTEDVPVEFGEYNTPYWIVEDSVIPTDRTFRNAWEIYESFGSPDGFGGESNEFTDEHLFIIYISKFINMLKFTENETVIEHITNNKNIYLKVGLLIREFIPNKEDRISSYNLYFDNKMIQDSLIMVDNTLDMELNNDNSK